RHFAAEIGKETRGVEATLSDDSLNGLRAHRWPGNVRELENAIERACILADSTELQPRDLGLVAGAAQDPKSFGFDLSGTLTDATDRAIRMIERQKIADTMASKEATQTRAAEATDVSYT